MNSKNKEVILHIGTQKTGTTSIQKFFKINKEILSDRNIYTPNSLDIGNGHHRWITTIANNENYVDSFIANQEFKTKEDRLIKVNNKKKDFLDELEKIEGGKWIISSEHLQSELKTKEEIIRLKNLLESLFNKIKGVRNRL